MLMIVLCLQSIPAHQHACFLLLWRSAPSLPLSCCCVLFVIPVSALQEVPELPGTGHLTRSHSENAISVKEIITEIESIKQGAGPAQQKEGSANLTLTPKRNTVHDLPVEAIWASERVDQSEGHQEKEKDPLQAKQETAPSPQLSSCKSELEEGEQLSVLPEPKWCPGSVRRATLEFEERLRQEQEHQHVSPVCVLLTRKNSRNDSPAAELLPQGRTEELPLELAPEGGAVQGSEELLSLGAEQPAGRQLPTLLAHPTEPSPGQEEHRVVVSFDGTEEPALPSLLPKRIEIIEFTPMVRAAESPAAGNEQPAALPLLDENLNPSLCSEKAAASLRALVHPPLPEHLVQQQQATCTLLSPSEEGTALSFPLGAASPSAQPSCTPSASPDRSALPCVMHLEGVTEQSTSTDHEPTTLCGAAGAVSLPFRDSSQAPCQGGAGSSTSPHAANMDLLDISFLCCSLPHSSSSHSVGERSSSPGLVKQRAKEIEARIRHAGLTTPSQMKRSASLAKLDCLELSKDDLSEREAASRCASPVLLTCMALGAGFHGARSEQSLESPCAKCHPFSSPALQDPQPAQHFVEQLRTAECIAQSRPVERPLAQYAKECGSNQHGSAPSSAPTWTAPQEGASVLAAPRQQHGRTHPLRRLKKSNDRKRTTNPLYNTM